MDTPLDRAALSAPQLALSIAFRRSGWQWPFREGDTLRVYRDDGALVAELPAPFVLELVRHHLMGHALQAAMAEHLTALTAPSAPAPRPLPTLPDPGPDPLPLAKATPRLGGVKGRRRRGLAP